ncbi:hypothetical protein PLESTM_001167000 [Pleodorina starrii]|nr:hypothetical protein PLESTM_001167000 [Pleodorina starrii]
MAMPDLQTRRTLVFWCNRLAAFIAAAMGALAAAATTATPGGGGSDQQPLAADAHMLKAGSGDGGAAAAPNGGQMGQPPAAAAAAPPAGATEAVGAVDGGGVMAGADVAWLDQERLRGSFSEGGGSAGSGSPGGSNPGPVAGASFGDPPLPAPPPEEEVLWILNQLASMHINLRMALLVGAQVVQLQTLRNRTAVAVAADRVAAKWQSYKQDTLKVTQAWMRARGLEGAELHQQQGPQGPVQQQDPTGVHTLQLVGQCHIPY